MLFWVLCVSLGLCQIAASVEVESSLWQEKYSFLLGSPWIIEEYEATFTEAPHTIKNVACPRVKNGVLGCPPTDPDGCDFTNCTGKTSCDGYISNCNSSGWIILTEGNPFTVGGNDHPPNTYKQFRYFYNSSLPVPSTIPTNGCRALLIEIIPYNGLFDIYFDFDGPSTNAENNTYAAILPNVPRLVVCPTEKFRTSTFYISVLSHEYFNQYDIVVSTIALPLSSLPLQCTQFTEAQCISDGDEYRGNSNQKFRYLPFIEPDPPTANEDDCSAVHFQLNSFHSNIILTVLVYATSSDQPECAARSENCGTFIESFSVTSQYGIITLDISQCHPQHLQDLIYFDVIVDISSTPVEGNPQKKKRMKEIRQIQNNNGYSLWATIYCNTHYEEISSLTPFNAMRQLIGKVNEGSGWG
jgi:hypothetical protein